MIAILSTVPGSVCLTSSCIGPERREGREMSRILTIGNHAIIERERPLNDLAIADRGRNLGSPPGSASSSASLIPRSQPRMTDARDHRARLMIL